MAAAVAELGSLASKQAGAFMQDPIEYFISVSRKLGTGLLIAGTGMGISAYYLKAAATAAMNNELNVVQNIGTIFSNIKTPTFTPAPTGTAPVSFSVQGVQNFFGDAWGDVQAAGSDVAQIGAVMGTLAEDLATAVIDVAKAFVAFVMHFPDILWNGLMWGVGGAIADVLTWAFPWLIIVGGGLVIASIVAYSAKWAYGTFAKPRIDAAVDRVKARIIKSVSSAGKEAGSPIVSTGSAGSEAQPPPPAPKAEEPIPPEPANGSLPPPSEEISHETPPLNDETPAEPEPEKPLPQGWSQEEMEEYLGKAREAEQDART